jgi:hypothetical protein
MLYKFQRTTKKETSSCGNQYARFPRKWTIIYLVDAPSRVQAKKELEREILICGYENKYSHSVK